MNGETQSFAWSDEHCDVTDDARQLEELRIFIQSIVAEKEAYQQLPEPEGGYD